jgi:hypothetical protein
MLRCALSRSRWVSAGIAWAVCWAPFLVVPPAVAQIAPGDGVPRRVYFNSLPAYYEGDYRNALGSFLNEERSGIQNATSRWIDSICYFTMAGECYYQLGQLPDALDQYNTALKLYVTYSNWMMRVQFPQVIGPATAGVVRATPWGQSKRAARVGQFPATFLMGQGQIDNSVAVFAGGVVQQAVLFPVHVSEIVRCTSLAIRRRRELMGPVCKYDALTNDLVDVLSRHPGPPNHWSEAWVNVQLGCAYAAAGNTAQATTVLQKAILVGGEFDHPLTSTALLELGRLALEAGDFPAATRYCEEATYACVNFPDSGILEEAFRLGSMAHLLLNAKTVYAPLLPAMAWAKAQGYRQLQASLLLLAAENLAALGDTAQATSLLSNARLLVARSDLAASQLGARMNHLTALASYQAGNVAVGDQALSAALAFQRSGSLWMFQIALADNRYTSGTSSDRVGMTLYETMLRDPTQADWASSPLECLSVLTTPHSAVLEHWFEAAVKNSKEHEVALEIADRARRHRFFSTLPMGGRLLALRWILEGPTELLGERGLLERQDLLARYPKYAELARQAAKIRAKLAEKPLADGAADARREQAGPWASLAEISQAQEVILREIGVRREPAEMVFPPLRTTKDIQQALPEGQVLLAFFATSRNLYAFLYGRDKYATWRINSPVQLQKQTVALLRDMGNFEANHDLTLNDLAKGTWHATAAKVMSLLLERSNVDLAGNFDEIVIVPDGMLWYLPFEALTVGKGEHEKRLISQARVRYAPTVGLAVPYSRVQKPRPTIGVLLGKLHPQSDPSVATAAFEQLRPVVDGAIALPHGLPAAFSIYRTLLDGLIVLDDIQPGDGPYDWSPSAGERGKSGGALSHWFALPWGGPEQVILPGFHTVAENGMRKGQASGNDLFLAVCGLMSTGARTILISRWRTGGQTTFDLVREFAQELPHASPAEAWQRSVQIATETPIEPDREPRLKKGSSSAEPPTAGHPFFWAGYLLVDSGVAPPGQDKVLALPGLNAPKKDAPPQPANPPRVQGLPMPDDAAADPQPNEKRGKKAKPFPRTAPKKVPSRQKPGPSDPAE